MRRTIWKFPIGTDPTLWLPEGAELLTVAVQRGTAYLCALVDPNAPVVGRTVAVVGTGHEIEGEPGAYVGTLHMASNGIDLVFHVFDLGPSQSEESETRGDQR